MELKIEKRDIIAVILIPIQFFAGWIISLTSIKGSSLAIVLIVIIQALCVYFLCFHLYRETLRQDWTSYRKKLWLKIFWIIIGVVVLHLLVYLVRQILPMPNITASGTENNEISSPSTLILIFSAISPILAPFQEEIIFRHVLFFKFLKHKFLVPILLIVSSFLF
jgi:membrane protease YdiL (CAAX protease family)